jgi:outer membrane protein assembly factor BamB
LGFAWVPAPAVANGVVYDMAGDGTLYAIDATSGTKLWSATTGSPTPSSLVVANGVVYVASCQGLFAFNTTTGALRWSDNFGLGCDNAPMVPAVANGLVYTTIGGQLSAHDATTGKAVWAAPTSFNGGASSPAVADGVVYVSDAGTLFAFNATTGAPQWSAAIGAGAPWLAPAVANGVVYESTNGSYAAAGKVSAFNATTGAPLWSTAVGGPLPASSPSVANGVVYVGGADGKIDAFNATTGAQLWSGPSCGCDWPNPPVVADGAVYITADEGIYGEHLEAYGLRVPGAALTVSPTLPLDYGTRLDGTSSAETTFTVTNFGASATTPLTDTFIGADPTQFHVTSDTCARTVLAGGATCTIGAKFTPTLPGLRTAALAVHAANSGSAGANLSGTGNALTIDPTSNDYGFVPGGTSSPPTTFTVTNHSATTVMPNIASLVGSGFTATSDTCTGATLAAGATCSIAVAFAPSRANAYDTGYRATISASATPGVTTTANLSGTGTPLAIAPQTEDYGTVPVGSSSAATFTITNVSTAALPVGFSPSSVTGSGFSITSDSCNGTALAAGASCTVIVTFTPTVAATNYRGQLIVQDIGGYGVVLAEATATLVGTGPISAHATFNCDIRAQANAKYVSAELGYTGSLYAALRARSSTLGAWEKYQCIAIGTNQWAIRSRANGKYVTAELGYAGSLQGTLRARASTVGSWEQFTIVPTGSLFALNSSANSKYASTELNYAGSLYSLLRARAGSIGSWETYSITIDST